MEPEECWDKDDKEECWDKDDKEECWDKDDKEECWDKDDEPMHFVPVLSDVQNENADDDPNLLKSFLPDVKDSNSLSWENNCADAGGQDSTCGEDGETKSTGSSSDCPAFVVGKFQHRKPKAKFSYAFEDKKVYVTNVSFKMSQKVLWNFFGKFGEVKHCRLVLDRFGKSVGRAVVTFCDENGTKAAIGSSDDERELYGRTLHVTLYRRKIFDPIKSSEELETQPKQTSTDTFDGADATDGTSVDGGLVQSDGSSVDPQRIASSSDQAVSASTSAYSPINFLNDDMMARIFEYLSLRERLLAERVCKRWRLLSIQFWSSTKRLQICNGMGNARCFTDRDLKKLLQRGSTSLRSLDLSRSFGMLTDQSVNAIAKWCESLREVNLSGMNISNKGLQTLAEKCRGLEVIIIQDSQRIGEKGLWWIFHRCKKLKRVDLKGVRGLKGQCLHVLCEDVLQLNLENCEKLMDVGIQKVHEKCPRLQELSVANCLKLTDTAFTIISQCKTIKSLDVSRISPNVTTFGLMALRHLKQLEHLAAFNCPHVFNDSVLMAISQGCRRLRSLNISNTSCSLWAAEDQITDVGVENLAAYCPLLSSVNLGDRPKISDSSLKILSQLDHLKELVIRRSLHLTDSGVMCVLTGCPVLQMLDLTGCVYVSESSVLVIKFAKELTASLIKYWFDIEQIKIDNRGKPLARYKSLLYGDVDVAIGQDKHFYLTADEFETEVIDEDFKQKFRSPKPKDPSRTYHISHGMNYNEAKVMISVNIGR